VAAARTCGDTNDTAEEALASDNRFASNFGQANVGIEAKLA
jgi:hypothetical protein